MTPPVSTTLNPASGPSGLAADRPEQPAAEATQRPTAKRSSALESVLAARPPGGAPPQRIGRSAGREPPAPLPADKSPLAAEGAALARRALPPLEASTPAAAGETTQHSMELMLAAQQAVAEQSLRGQLVASEMNMNNQTVGALASMAVQTVTDQAKAGKEAARAQGEAFQKAN